MAWPKDKKAYDPYTDPKLTRNQGGTETIKKIDSAARSAVMATPGARVASAGIGMAKDAVMALPNKIKADNANQSDALAGKTAGNTNLALNASRLKDGLSGGNLPWGNKEMPLSPVNRPSYAGNGQPQAAATPQQGDVLAQNGIARPGVGSNLPSKVSYAGTNGARGSISVAPGQANASRPWTNGIEQGNGSRQPVSIHSLDQQKIGGLDVQFDKSMPADERGRFAESALKEAARPSVAMAQPQVMGLPQASGIGQHYSPPTSDGTIGGNIVQRRTAAMQNAFNKTNNDADRNTLDARGQDLTADAALRRDGIAVRGQDMDYGIQSDRNQLDAQNGLVQREGQTIQNQTAQLGLDQTQEVLKLMRASANADPTTDEGKAIIAESERRYAAMNPQKTQNDNFTAAAATLDENGRPVMPVIYNKATGEVKPGQEQYEAPTDTTTKLMIKNKGNKAYEDEYIKRFGKLPY